MIPPTASPSLQVIYESEPLDHGAAANALPALSPAFLRGLLAELLPTVEDLDSLVIDYFRPIHRQFSPGMTRAERENLLLAGPPPLALYEALRDSYGSRVPPPPAEERAALPNPYRGLLVFGVQDAPLYFGRHKKTAELRRMFDAAVQPAPDAGPVLPRLVAVMGPSGSGKSSLAQAGLLADLSRKPPPTASYVAMVLRPQGRPLRALARCLARLRNPSAEWPLNEIDTIADKLRSGPRALGDLVSDVLTEPQQRLLLVVDQLEELYTMAEASEAGTAERQAFVCALLGAASERGGRVDVVVTLRSDLLGETSADPKLQEALTASGRALLVGSLSGDELTEAVAGPAARTGRPLPPDAVALLVGEAEGQAGALPLLQFTLQKLWTAMEAAPDRPLAQLLEELGGVGGALAQEAESLYLSLNPQATPAADKEPPPNAAQMRARRAFARLLQTREGQVLGRRRQALADLIGDKETLGDVRAVLDRFVTARLLVLDGEGAEAMVEIGHESLGRSWSRLEKWLTETAAYLPVLLRLSEDARRWHKQSRPGWLLWRGDDLAVLRRALPALEGSGDLGAGERAFARASVAGARRRQVVAAVGVLGLVVALAGVSALAIYARRQADLAQKRLHQAIGVADLVVFNVTRRLANIPGTADLRKSLLEEAMGMLDDLRKQAGAADDLALLRTRASGNIERGKVAMTHDNLTVAHREYLEAQQLFETVAQRQPNSSNAQRDLSISLEHLGDVAVQMGQLAEAKGAFQRSLNIREKRALADPNDARAQRDLSISLEMMGNVAVKLGQLAEAKGSFERSLKISEKRALADPNDAQAQRDLSFNLSRVADLAMRSGQLDQAEALMQRSLKVNQGLADENPLSVEAQRDVLADHIQLAGLLHQRRLLPAAASEARTAAALLAKLRPRLPASDAQDLERRIQVLSR